MDVRDGGNGLELHVGKYGAAVRGRDTIIIVLLGVALAAFVFVDYKGQLERKQEHESMAKELRIQTWIQSIPPDQRPMIMMPPEAEGRIIGTRKDSRRDVDRGFAR